MMDTGYTCYLCGERIKTRSDLRLVSPSRWAVELGDFGKAYHPACYDKAEQAAGRELRLQSEEGSR